ncbi:MAG: dihydroorotate dehydrogenase electron transfer subunit [Lachnospiraceae bacterium]|nr:dihydroorotate dehydrogenase electron transfer subunit [Lachnospiraceae bacterium]
MAQKKKVSAVITAQKEIAPDIFDMWMQTELAKEAKAGQFIAVYPRNESTLLPRPISICEVDEKREKLRIVYRIAGKGTREFSAYKEGEEAAILGILGNGFPIESGLSVEKEFSGEKKQVFLMGGGIGIPPMLELAKEISSCAEQDGNRALQINIIAGYRDGNLFLKEDLEKYGNVYIATEDGSVGTKGNVMDAIRENNLHADVIYACGPMPMLRAIKTYAKEQGINAYVSLEERMACGVGACLGCVCKTKNVDHHSRVKNARICTDGPVFEADEVEI